MEIKVNNIFDDYAEVILKDGLTTIESGTLDQTEIKDLAVVFIEAAYDLLSNLKKDTDR